MEVLSELYMGICWQWGRHVELRLMRGEVEDEM